MRQLIVLLLLLYSVASAYAEDGLILREPALDSSSTTVSDQQTSSNDLLYGQDESNECEDLNAPRQEKAPPVTKHKPSKPATKPKKDPGMIDWMFKKHKMPSLHFIDLLEMIH